MASDAKDALAVIPWYWRDWRASKARAVLLSDPAALMAYRELLDAMWGEDGCFLPSDDESLAALAGLSFKGWMKVREKVLRFLSDDGNGRLTHPRSQHEYSKAVAYRDGCRRGGQKTAAKRWGSDSPPTADLPPGNRTPSPTLFSDSSPTQSQNSRVVPEDGDEPPAEVSTKAERKPKPIHPLGALWNAVAGDVGLPKVAAWTSARDRAAKGALVEEPDLAVWDRAFRAIGSSKFHKGGNDRGWKADFDFAIRPSSRGKWLDEARNANATENHAPVLTPAEIEADMARRRELTNRVRNGSHA